MMFGKFMHTASQLLCLSIAQRSCPLLSTNPKSTIQNQNTIHASKYQILKLVQPPTICQTTNDDEDGREPKRRKLENA